MIITDLFMISVCYCIVMSWESKKEKDVEGGELGEKGVVRSQETQLPNINHHFYILSFETFWVQVELEVYFLPHTFFSKQDALLAFSRDA